MWWRTRWRTRSIVSLGEVQPSQEILGHLGADRVVAEEVPVGSGRGLADVVEECREPHDRAARRSRVDGSERVVPEVLAGDLVLGHAPLRRQLGRDALEDPGLCGEPEADGRQIGGHQLLELARDPLARQVADQVGVASDRLERRGLDGEAQRCGEADGTDHPERVLREPTIGIADRAKEARLDIGPPAERVDQVRRVARGARPRPSR